MSNFIKQNKKTKEIHIFHLCYIFIFIVLSLFFFRSVCLSVSRCVCVCPFSTHTLYLLLCIHLTWSISVQFFAKKINFHFFLLFQLLLFLMLFHLSIIIFDWRLNLLIISLFFFHVVKGDFFLLAGV